MTMSTFTVLRSRWCQPACRLFACLLLVAAVVAAAIDARCEEPVPIRVVVWDERQPEQKQAYDKFLGNAIAETISVGLKEEAAAMILDYNQRFPNDSSTASHYDFLAGYEQDKGNLDAACAYYRQAIATGKAMSESTEVFEINLAQLEGRPRPPSRTPIEKAPSDQDPRFWLLVANGTLVVVLLTWYVWRRWAHPRATH